MELETPYLQFSQPLNLRSVHDFGHYLGHGDVTMDTERDKDVDLQLLELILEILPIVHNFISGFVGHVAGLIFVRLRVLRQRSAHDGGKVRAAGHFGGRAVIVLVKISGSG